MNLVRWHQPSVGSWTGFNRLTDLRDEIDRLFEAPLAELARTSNLLSGWTPAIDLYEEKDHYTVRAELPGMKRDDIAVSFQDGCLSISGERKTEEKTRDAEIYRAERYFGRFQRTISLPGPVAMDKVKAQYKEGVLSVTLPKTEEAKPKQIDVSVS